MNPLPFALFLSSLIGISVVAILIQPYERLRSLASLLLTGVALFGLGLAAFSLLQARPITLDLSAYFPFPVAFGVDRLSAFFLLVVCALTAPVVIFSGPYSRQRYQGAVWAWYWSLLPLFVLSMVVVVAASTIYTFLFGWELMTLLSAGLILLEGAEGERRHNLFIYLLMMHAGAAAVLAAFLAFLPHAGGATFEGIRASAAHISPAMRALIFLLAFAGFGVKAGIVPLHIWLPKAHPIAPSPVSALMSGVMLKTAVYGLVRFAFDFLGTPPFWWGYLVLVAGAVSGLLGVLYALGEHDLKRLLAYHSVENIGIIYLGLGASLLFMSHQSPVWATLALVAALLHTLNHALFKGLLFLGAGAIHCTTHTLDLEELGGLSRNMPVVSATFLIGCCAIVGLPPLNGFVSEWLTFRSFLGGGGLDHTTLQLVLPMMIGVLGLIGGLAAACFVKAYGISFLGRPRTTQAQDAPNASPAMQLAMALLAFACVLLGIFPGIVLKPLLLVAASIIPNAGHPPEIAMISRTLPIVTVSVLGVILLCLAFTRGKRRVETWACGQPGLTARMQYAGASFSKPIRFVFSFIYKPDRKLEVLPADKPYFPETISYHSVRTTSFEKTLYRPAVDLVVAAAQQLRRLHTGNIQAYLLYIFLMLVALLAYLRFSQ